MRRILQESQEAQEAQGAQGAQGARGAREAREARGPRFRTIARLCVFLCTALPVQRWALALGPPLVLLGLLITPFAPLPAIMLGTLAFTGMVFVSLFSVAWLFRALSQPGAHRLVPGLRGSLLAAVLVLLALSALLPTLVVLATDAPASPVTVVLYVTLLGSGVLWGLFFLPASIWGLLLFGVFTGVAARVPEPQLEAFTQGIGPVIGAAIVLVGWSVFAVWYLRAPRIGPFAFRFPLFAALDRRMNVVLPETVSRELASMVQVGHRPPPGPSSWLVIMPLAALLVALVIAVAESHHLSLILTVIFISVLSSYRVGQDAARHARALWLKSPLSREGLYREAERVLVRAYVPAIVVMSLSVWGVLLWHGRGAAGLVASLLSLVILTALLGGYIGLMRVRPWRALDVGALAVWLLSVPFAILALAVDAVAHQHLLAVVALQATMALLCRSVGERRWRTLDWLPLRAGRPSAGDYLTEMLGGKAP